MIPLKRRLKVALLSHKKKKPTKEKVSQPKPTFFFSIYRVTLLLFKPKCQQAPTKVKSKKKKKKEEGCPEYPFFVLYPFFSTNFLCKTQPLASFKREEEMLGLESFFSFYLYLSLFYSYSLSLFPY